MLILLFLSGIRSSLSEGCEIFFGLCRSDLGNKQKNPCHNLVYYKTVSSSHTGTQLYHGLHPITDCEDPEAK